MNIVFVNIYFQYIMLKFINYNALVQHLLLMNIYKYYSMYNKNVMDIFRICKAFQFFF